MTANYIDRVENEENIELVIDDESFRVKSVDITTENEGEEYHGADEYEVIYDSSGRPFFIPVGPRKLQAVSVDRMSHGTIRGVGERPDIPRGKCGVPQPVDAILKMDSRAIDLPNTIFTGESGEEGEWALEFISDHDD